MLTDIKTHKEGGERERIHAIVSCVEAASSDTAVQSFAFCRGTGGNNGERNTNKHTVYRKVNTHTK